MRVFLTTDAVGGVWTYARDLALGLAARGETVTLAVLGPVSVPTRSELDLPGVRVMETGLPLDWLAADEAELREAGRALAAEARAAGAQIAHLSSPALAAFGDWPGPVVGVCHSDLLTWWAAVRGGEPPEDFRWRGDALARGYRACDALLAPSAAFAEATAARYGVRPSVVWNGRAAPAPTPPVERDIAVLAAGRLWDEGKGVAVLAAAADRLPERVRAIGPVQGPQGQGVEAGGLELPGALPAAEVAATLRRARIFCSPAVYEPFGLAVLEAAQAGCALVLSDIPTFRELWDGAAVFAPAGDAAALAAALRALLDDEGESRRLAAAARAQAARYGLTAFVEANARVHRRWLSPSIGRGAAA